jgi:hypothetical protein
MGRKVSREALRAAVALAAASAFDADIDPTELLDGADPQETAEALALVLGVILNVTNRTRILGLVGQVAADNPEITE